MTKMFRGGGAAKIISNRAKINGKAN